MRILKLAIIVSLVSVSATASAIDFTAHGYYRTRGELNWNLDAQKYRSDITRSNDRFGLIAFNQMRLRLEPIFKINDNISIHSQFDILDNVLYGTESTKQLNSHSPVVGTLALPAGPGSVSMVGGQAGENKALNIRRVWMDILTPIGKLRFGRQASHWGLGIVANDGNDRQGDFGDTSDRVSFMTQYPFNDGSSISMIIAWDIAFESQVDPSIDGLAGAIRDNGQDTHQFAGVLIYERPSFAFGMFGGIRRRSGGNGTTTTAIDALGNSVAAGIDGDTLVYFADLYTKYSIKEHDFQLEFVYVGGSISTGVAVDAIPFSIYTGGSAGDGIISMPANQDLQVIMAAAEISGAYKWGGEWVLKTGFAEGDASPLSQRITQYGFRPDYNIALLMFNVPLGTSPSMWGTSAITGNSERLVGGVPVTANFINNAIYVALGYQHHFNVSNSCIQCNDLSFGGRGVTAWAHKNPVDLDFQAILNDNALPVIRNSNKWYGFEFDILLEAEFFDHLYTSLEAGILVPGGAYDVKVDTLQLGNLIETIPFDKANLAYGGRLTLMVEF